MREGSGKREFVAPFEVLENLRKASDRLQEAVLHEAFPDLDTDPSSDDEVRARVSAAGDWARRVQAAYGPGSPEIGRSTGGRPLLGWLRRRERTAASQAPTLDRATDVIGEPPDLYQDCRASLIFELERGIRPRAGHMDVAMTVEMWPEIRLDLEQALKVITTQSLSLVQWTRERIRHVEKAIIPEITKKVDLPRNSVLVIVRMAGGQREATLEGVSADLLTDLARDGMAKALRTAKSKLVAAIPELKLWISTAPRAPELEGNESRYALAEEVRPLIRMQGASGNAERPSHGKK